VYVAIENEKPFIKFKHLFAKEDFSDDRFDHYLKAYDEFDENDSDDWHPGSDGIGIEELDELFDLNGDGKLDDFESALEYDVIFDDDE